MERGTYCDLTRAKSADGIADTDSDVRILQLLETASRRFDRDTGRKFYVAVATRYFTAAQPDLLLVPDLLAVTALHTDDGSRTYPYEWAVTDYDLEPSNTWPKWEIAAVGDYRLPVGLRRGVRIVGLWNHGDGGSAAPWSPSALTITCDELDTTPTVAGGALTAGQTLLVGDEQVYCLSATEVERGVNGTTASPHAGSAVSVARYPSEVIEAVLLLASFERLVPATGTVGGGDIGTVTTGPQFARYRGIVEAFRVPGVG